MEVGSKKDATTASSDSQDSLNILEGFKDLIGKKEGALDEDSIEQLKLIKEDTERMSDLMRQISIYTKVNETAKAFERIDIQSLVKEVLISLDDVIEYRNANLDVVLPFQKLIGQPQQIKILFQYLISNGIKFNKSKEPKIKISYEEGDAEWNFAISDNGIGIDKQHREAIFQPFKCLNPSYQFAGNGIGLFICKTIISNHGGEMSFVKNTAGGTTFHFTLSKNISLAAGQEGTDVFHWVATGF